jgi:ketosteroid isomerase-like protein
VSAAGDVARLTELTEDFYAAFESGDLDAMDALWVNGELAASVTCVHPGWPALRGRDEVMRSWAMIMANTTYIQFVLTDIEVEVGTDFAVLTCVENILTADDDDDADSSDFAGAKGVATNVFRRMPEGWRLWVRHGSPVISSSHDDDDE